MEARFSFTNEVSREISRVIKDSPGALDAIGGEGVFLATISRVVVLDTGFENRGGLLFKAVDSSSDTADTFTTVHIDDYRKNGRPSLPSLTLKFAEELGLDKNSAEYKAMIMVATRAEVLIGPQPQYHNKKHYVDVTAVTGNLLKKNNELANAGNKDAIRLSPQECALNFIAALGHDLDHPGGKNPPKDPLFLERAAFEKMLPFLEEAGLTGEDIQTINTIITTTSPDGPHAILKEIARAHRDHDAVKWKKVDPENKFPQLRGLENDRKLTQMCAMLSDADLYASGGAGMRSHSVMCELFTNELRAQGTDIDLCTHEAQMVFFEDIIGPEGFASTSGRHVANEMHMAMRAEAEQNVQAAEPGESNPEPTPS